MKAEPLRIPAPTRGAYPGAEPRRGLSWRVRMAFGLRRSFNIEGVRYKEVTTEPLRTALSKRGGGFKEYDVTFRAGSRLRIRCSRERVFADLVPPPSLPVYLRIERSLRPGMRVLLTPCGTGYAGAMVAGRVSPSGAVVALDPDDQSIEYARQRYSIQNVSFERGGLGDVAGETDGAFDAVVSVDHRLGPPDDAVIAELWRLVGPEGWLLIAFATPLNPVDAAAEPAIRRATDDLLQSLSRLCAPAGPSPSRANIAAMGDGRDGWIAVLARRSHEAS